MDGIGLHVLHTEHLGHRRAEDVAVQQAHLVAQSRQRDGQVGRDGRLAHAALARAHGYDVLHLGQHFAHFGSRRTLEFGFNLHLHVLAAVVFDGGLGSLHRRLQERVGVAVEHQHHLRAPHAALAVVAHTGRVAHHLALHQVLLRSGIGDCGQRLQHLLRIQCFVFCHNVSCFLICLQSY